MSWIEHRAQELLDLVLSRVDVPDSKQDALKSDFEKQITEWSEAGGET